MGLENANLLSIGQGICNHGLDCCPHNVTIYTIYGSDNVNSEGLGQVRLLDDVLTTCPHCGHGIIISSSETVFANNLGVARLTDDVLLDAGWGTITSDTTPTVISG